MLDFTPPIFNSLAMLTLVSLMLSLGLTVSFRQVISLWQRPGLLNRAVLGMCVIVPLLSLGIGFALSLSAEVKAGLVLVSLSPGTSLPLYYLVKTEKNHLYSGALQTTTAFLAIVTVPISLAIINEFSPEAFQIDPFNAVKQISVFQLLPLSIGLIGRTALHPYYSISIEKSAKYLVAIGTLILYGLLIWALVQQFNTVLGVGIPAIAAIALLAFISLWIGHWIGGKDIAACTLLALTLSTHNVALALLIAIANLPSITVCPLIALYAMISAGLAIAYGQWNQHRLKQTKTRLNRYEAE